MVSAINRDDAIIDKLGWALTHLQDTVTLMEGHVVGGHAWPQVGRLLSEIERTIKGIELSVGGFG